MWRQEKSFNCLEHDIREYLMVADVFWEDKFHIMLRTAAREGFLLPQDSKNWDQVPAVS